jgi:apolipoprotein N-acyltransferase
VVVQTADTTFQDSWGPAQHASLAAVRAVEAGRPVAQAAISGVSAAFDARGRRLAWQPTSWKGVAVVEVPLSRERTPYARTGDWLPVAGALALAAAALVESTRAGGRRRSTAGPGGATLRSPGTERPAGQLGVATDHGRAHPTHRDPHQRR